jgi:hypothetical protein
MQLILAQKGHPSYTERTISLNFCMKMHLEKRDEDMSQVKCQFVISVFNTQNRVGVVHITQHNSRVAFLTLKDKIAHI